MGGSKIGWGVQLANAGYNFNPRYKGAAKLFAHRVAQGATTYIPGTGVWILDTLQARVRGERQLYSMGSQDALPHQKLNRRLAKLGELEQVLR